MPCRSAFLGASNYGLVVMDQGGGHKGPSYTQLHLTTTAPLLGLMNNANYAALLGWVSVRARPELAGDVSCISCRCAAHAAHTAASNCAALPGLFTPASVTGSAQPQLGRSFRHTAAGCSCLGSTYHATWLLSPVYRLAGL